MLFSWKKTVLLLALRLLRISVGVHAQDYLSGDEIAVEWTAVVGPVASGNGAFMAPDESSLVVVSRDCTVNALGPYTGALRWTYTPAEFTVCNGGIFFNYEAAMPYMVYAVEVNGST